MDTRPASTPIPRTASVAAPGGDEAPANLLGMTRRSMQAFFASLGEKPYRAEQVMKWLYHGGVDDFDAMTNIAKPLRERLRQVATIDAPAFGQAQRGADGVLKWAARTAAGQAVETVLIPDRRGNENGTAGRNTLCISSQVGCALDCSFCATGKQGFGGNLGVAEIVGQVWRASRELAERGDRRGITNVVFMGMGEPLLNFAATMDAAEVLMDDLAFGISKRRVTISTSGVVPRIYDMTERADVSLAVSLHAARDGLRDRLVPLNRKYPIAELLDACRHYLRRVGPRRSVTFEYTLIEGVNDGLDDADDLVRLLASMRCKVNLIPFNPFAADAHGYRRPGPRRVARFQKRLMDGGLATMLRTTRGDDIAAACGQLTGDFEDRTRRRARRTAAANRPTANGGEHDAPRQRPKRGSRTAPAILVSDVGAA